MRRAHLEHIIRAAASVSGDNEIVIIGSQAILGQLSDPPAALTVSMEADVFPKNRAVSRSLRLLREHRRPGDCHRAGGMDGSARAAPQREHRRRDRVVSRNPRPHPCQARRRPEKDLRYCEAAARTGLVDTATLRARIPQMAAESTDLGRLYGFVERLESLRFQDPELRRPGP